MSLTLPAEPPDPMAASNAAEFIDLLRQLRVWAGNPPLAAMVDGTGVPRSTIHDALNPRRTTLPTLDLVCRIVQVLGQDVTRWEAAWRSLTERRETLLPPAPPAAAQQTHGRVPRQLPAEGYGFTGRKRDIKQLNELLDDNRASVAAVCGPPGVGKTALALHWAHDATSHFPDGQLYLDLQGYSQPSPLTHAEALQTMLRAMGATPDDIPSNVDAQAGLYRSMLADRRMLIVLDNAANVRQIRPLLPGTPTCLTLITSRHALGGLVAREGARRIDLRRLNEPDAVDLLSALLGAGRVGQEPQAAADLARLCGYLPLALRIVAANLVDRPFQTLAGYAAHLASADRLAALRVSGDDLSAVSAAFDASYAVLEPEAQHLLGELSQIPEPVFDTQTAAVLIGASPDRTAALLDSLVAAHLVEAAAHDQFAMSDLIRLYAMSVR